MHRSCQLTCGDGQQLSVLERADVGEVVQVACSRHGQGAVRAAGADEAHLQGVREPGQGTTFSDPADEQLVWRDVGERRHLNFENLRACATRGHFQTGSALPHVQGHNAPRRRRAPTVGRVDLEVIELRAEHQCHLDHAAGSQRPQLPSSAPIVSACVVCLLLQA